jgi:hypothetical protein
MGVRRVLEYTALVLLLLLAIDAFISVGLTCHEIGNYPGDQQAAIKNCCTFDGPLLARFILFAGFFDKHEGTITALFTVILALSTIALWWSTDKLWLAGEAQRKSSERIADRQRHSSERIAMEQRMQMRSSITASQTAAKAAKKSADAAMGVALPQFVVTRVLWPAGNYNLELALRTERPDVTLRNFGRSNAVVTSECLVVRPALALSSEPDYPADTILPVHFGQPVDKGEPHQVVGIPALTDEQISARRRRQIWRYRHDCRPRPCRL